MIFAKPIFLLVLLLIPIALRWLQQHGKQASLLYPNTTALKELADTRSQWLSKVSIWLRVSILIVLVIALAQPQRINSSKRHHNKGIDILLVLDLSETMAINDIKPSRIHAAKKTMMSFISKRKHDKLGLLVFGKDAFTACPMTSDHSILSTFLNRTGIGMVNPYGTAIGLAIATGIPRFDKTKKSNVMVLLTDGDNNAGGIDPLTAAKLAKKEGVKIYTIGIGKKDAYNPSLLQQIADITNGQFFAATDDAELKTIYKDIDQLETYDIDLQYFQKKTDLFPYFLWTALLLLLLEISIINTVLVSIP